MEDRLEKLKQKTMMLTNKDKMNQSISGFRASKTSFYQDGDIQSTQSSVINRESVEKVPKRSLAEELRNRREMKERLSIERMSMQIDNNESPGMGMRGSKKVPNQVDNSGTAYRIRPQTPRINLLKQKPQGGIKLESIQPKQPMLIPAKQISYPPSEKQQVVSPQKQPDPKEALMQKLLGQSSVSTAKKIKIIKLKPKTESKPEVAAPDLGLERDINAALDEMEAKSDESFEQNNYQNDAFENIQEKLFQIIESEDVSDAFDLNEKFLSQQLGVEQQDLALLPKIELRVDTHFHNLQVTGEILSSLEYLKLNDSIIPSFRDIGTSFKNVRFLHIGRCELKDVQGIQAFEQLEELYIGYNEIDELFDIGFIEHLTVLDFEGNNLSDPEQLYYLKRCRKLTHLNLKYNPITTDNRTEYYSQIRDNCPLIEELDDEPVEPGFFTQKMDVQVKTKQHVDLLELQNAKKFRKMGLSEEILRILNTESIKQINEEPCEEILLVKTIKSQTAEKKASRDYFEAIEDFDRDADFRKTFAQSFHGSMVGSESKDPMRESTMSFFKEAYTKPSDTISNFYINQRNQDTENNELECDVNFDDSSMTGNMRSVLKNRRMSGKTKLPSEQKALRGSSSTVGMSCDIKSLIQEFHQDTASLKERVNSRGGMGKTSQNFSQSISATSQKKRYDPYDNTSFEESSSKKTPSLSGTVPRMMKPPLDASFDGQSSMKKPPMGAPNKIKLLDSSKIKKKIKLSKEPSGESPSQQSPIKVRTMSQSSANKMGAGPIKAGKLILKKSSVKLSESGTPNKTDEADF